MMIIKGWAKERGLFCFHFVQKDSSYLIQSITRRIRGSIDQVMAEN